MKRATLRILSLGLMLSFLVGCSFTLESKRTELLPGSTGLKRVALSIDDSGLGGGTQSYVNASFKAAVKQAVPGAVLVAGGEDLGVELNMIAPVLQFRWYTFLTLGLLREYYQLGSMRIINNKTGEILAIHTVTIKGKRVFPLGVEDYQSVVIPKLLELVTVEMKNNGLASSSHLELDLETLTSRAVPPSSLARLPEPAPATL